MSKQIDKTLLNRQKAALRSWKNSGYEGTFEWATGTGKTFLSLLGAKHLRNYKDIESLLVVVPTDYLRSQWKQEVQMVSDIPFIRIDTVQMITQQERSLNYDLVIFDEIHNFTGGLVFPTIFKLVNWKYAIGLTAKERDKDENQELLEQYCPIVDQLPMAEALKNGWVSPFTVYNLGLELSSADRIKYDRMHSAFIKYFSTFDFDLNTMYAALSSDEEAEKIAKKMRWQTKMVKIHAAQANRVMQKRKQFLYTAEPLFDATVAIIEKFPGRKFITFNERTESCDKLTEMLEDDYVAASYHSSIPTQVRKEDGVVIARAVKVDGKTRYKDKRGEVYTWKQIKFAYRDYKLERFSGDRIKEEVMEQYKAGKIDIINTAKALNEGANIPNTDFAILQSYNSSVVESIQRTGRAIRKQDNKRAIEVNLYFRDTQSERWLRKKQKHTPNIKWVNQIKDIV